MSTAPVPAREPLISLERALALDAAMEADKLPRPGNPLVDGYEARRQAQALRLQSRCFPE
jgi:hypothetical protein